MRLVLNESVAAVRQYVVRVVWYCSFCRPLLVRVRDVRIVGDGHDVSFCKLYAQSQSMCDAASEWRCTFYPECLCLIAVPRSAFPLSSQGSDLPIQGAAPWDPENEGPARARPNRPFTNRRPS